MAVAHVAGAAWTGWIALQRGGTIPLQGAAFLTFVCLGMWFGVIAYRGACRSTPAASRIPILQRTYWRACGASLVACYAVGLLVGSHPSAPYAFWILLAASHAGTWFLLSGPAERLRFVAALFHRRPLRVAAGTLYVLLMAPLAGEVALRLYALAIDDSPMNRYMAGLLKLPAGGERLGQTVNSQGYWDEEFPLERLPSGLRVAALGDETVLCGDAESNFLAQIERLMPGVEVLNFGLPEASPREYAAQLQEGVAPYRPDVLLLCVSIASDITEAPPLPGPFDWRSLHLVQRSLGTATSPVDCGKNVDLCSDQTSEEPPTAKLDEAARQLQVCRVPVKESMRGRWRSVFDHLDKILRGCRDAGIEPTLVVMPCDFQVDDGLLQTLCRRTGYRRDQIDIDLPQRRLSAYAKDRRVQLLDLMPHLRASRIPTYRCDAAHFNEHGNTLAATILCEWLESEYGSTLLTGGP